MRLFLAFVLLLSTAHAACDLEFKAANVCASLAWTQGPVVGQASAFVLKFDRDFSPYQLRADLWMQMGGHGHGSRPLVMRSISGTEVEFTQAYFVMAGKWLVRAQLLNDAGAVVDRAALELKL